MKGIRVDQREESTVANYNKLRLGATLSSINGDNNNHGDCFDYGSVGGCDWDCPVLEKGECELQEEVERKLKMKTTMCPDCQGGDLLGEDPCPGCDGSGWKEVKA